MAIFRQHETCNLGVCLQSYETLLQAFLSLIRTSDPLPFQYLGKHSELCADATFLDVDYPQLMQRKLDVITQNAALRDLLPNLELGAKTETVLGHAEKYVAIGCDLRCLDDLEAVLRRRFNMTNSSVAILFTSEVATAYMTKEASDALLRWAIKFDDGRWGVHTHSFVHS